MNIISIANIKDVLVFDIETDSPEPTKAKLKYFGCYSYNTNKYSMISFKDLDLIQNLIDSHKFLCGYNSNNFDIEVLKRNGITISKYKIRFDCLNVLRNTRTNQPNRAVVLPNKDGKPLIEVLKDYKMSTVAQQLGFEIQKGDIDYNIFKQDSWNKKQTEEIKKYLIKDIKITKQLFEYLLNFFDNFKEYVDTENIRKFDYVRSSLGSYTYTAFCNMLNIPVAWEEDLEKLKERPENKGGFVLEPQTEYAERVIYFDFSSLYPMIFIQNNLFSSKCECCFEDDKWNGGDFFKLKGSYCKKTPGKVETLVKKIYNKRLKYKQNNDPKQLALKIMINALYGLTGSPKFKHFYNKYVSGDCTRIGRRCINTAIEIFNEKGFKVLYADTDSCFIQLPKNKTLNQAQQVADGIRDFLQSKMQFPFNKFEFKIDDEFNKIRFIKKKQYYGVNKNNDFIIKGLDIKKSNSSKLGRDLFEYIKPELITSSNLQFSENKTLIKLKSLLKKDISLIARQYNIKSIENYKDNSSIQSQISEKWGEGEYYLIPNNKIGLFGKNKKYCTPKQAKLFLKFDDLILDKTKNELKPFLF